LIGIYFRTRITMRQKILLLTVAATLATLGAQAQTDITLDDEAMYFESDELPNGVKWFPSIL